MHFKMPLFLWKWMYTQHTHTQLPVLDEMPLFVVFGLRSKHTIVPRIMRDQTATSSR